MSLQKSQPTCHSHACFIAVSPHHVLLQGDTFNKKMTNLLFKVTICYFLFKAQPL